MHVDDGQKGLTLSFINRLDHLGHRMDQLQRDVFALLLELLPKYMPAACRLFPRQKARKLRVVLGKNHLGTRRRGLKQSALRIGSICHIQLTEISLRLTLGRYRSRWL